jgi:N-acetylneuraminic acid mutarotase
MIFVSCGKDPVTPSPGTNNSTYTNLPPVVVVGGRERTITLPDTNFIVLDGTRSYDPDGIRLTLAWSQISGPTPAVFYDTYTRPGEAFAVFSTSGKYLFQLTARDNKFTTSDTVEITVKWASDCNPAREMVSAETAKISSSPSMVIGGLSCAIGNDKLVLAGGMLTEPLWPGDPAATYASSFHIYDMKTNTWSRSEMFRAKGEMACVITGNKLYIGGGATNDGKVTDEVEIHDLATRTATRAKLSVPRFNLAVATVGNKVVFAGGRSEDWSNIDVVDIYDQSTNSWSTAKLSEPRSDITAIVNGSLIYFVGGSLSFGTGLSNAVDIYDASSGSWTVRRMSRQGAYFQAAVLGSQMVLSGGFTQLPGLVSSRIEFVDPSNWSSTLDCNLSAQNPDYNIRGFNLNTEVIGDKVFFSSSESISVYNSTTKAWKYAKMDTYNGLLFTYQGQLYSLRYEYEGMQYQVIRIGI